MKQGRIRIGTSGWSYAHWVGPFYPENMAGRRFLHYYSQHLQSVEINNTFYHLPVRDTLETWKQETPNEFIFACKGSRFITHMKKLKDPLPSTKRFFETIDVLGDKLGPILFQLPHRWKVNPERLENFLERLPSAYRLAFEFRDESWFGPPTYEILAKHQAAFCVYHLAGRWSPHEMTADFVYIRLHGPNGPYQGSYDEATLQTWAKNCVMWARSGKDVYGYFDNDEKGYAVKDAMKLKNMLAQEMVTVIDDLCNGS